MSIEKLPKKLKDIFTEIRSGEVEQGINNLNSIKGFEAQKNIALAEIFYYNDDYDSAMEKDESSLLHEDKWYAGNILIEHFFAYTYGAMISNQIERAINFYNFFLECKEQLDLPSYSINQYRYQVEQHLLKLKGFKNVKIDPPLLDVLKEGKDKEEFEKLLKENRPKLNPDSIEGIEYILHFMITDSKSSDVFECYENYADQIRIENIHIDIARLYALSGKTKRSQETLIRYAEKCWWPVEHFQILPMKVFEYDELKTVLTSELKQQILEVPKATIKK